METYLFAFLAFIATYVGGIFALKFENKKCSIMALTAGVILGVIFFDILPEIMQQLKTIQISPILPMLTIVGGFLCFHILEKSVLIHHAHEGSYSPHEHPSVGKLSALALIAHSFMDGIGIGVGFHINSIVGIMIAIAIVSHDFADGMNTVVLMIKNKNKNNTAKLFLLFDALAPIAGVLTTMFFVASPFFLTLYLGFFAGVLLYICASDILPEAHSQRSSFKLIGLTITGTVFIFFTSILLKA